MARDPKYVPRRKLTMNPKWGPARTTETSYPATVCSVWAPTPYETRSSARRWPSIGSMRALIRSASCVDRGRSDGQSENFHHRKTSTPIQSSTRPPRLPAATPSIAKSRLTDVSLEPDTRTSPGLSTRRPNAGIRAKLGKWFSFRRTRHLAVREHRHLELQFTQ